MFSSFSKRAIFFQFIPQPGSSDHWWSMLKPFFSLTVHSVFHQFRQAKFDYGGSILSSSQFLLLLQLPQKVELTSKVVKVDSKIIVSLPEI
jgi:hypothetical protein